MTLPSPLRTAIVLLAAMLVLCVPAYAAQPAGAALPALAALDQRNAFVSAVVVDLTHDRVLAALNPGLRLTPASITKLYTVAGALENWGPDHHFETRLLTDGSIEDGVLKGNLMFRGVGDPGLTIDRLWLLVARLRQAGVREVSGHLIVNDGLFGPVPCITSDRCQARGGTQDSWDAPLSSAGVNFSTVELSIFPATEPGQPAQVVLLPPGLPGFTIDGTIATGAVGSRPRYSVWRETAQGLDTLHVNGRVPAGGGPFRVHRSVSDPSRYAGRVLSALLEAAGIPVAGGLVLSAAPVPIGYRTVAYVRSGALARQLRGMMTYSNNYMADTLTLDLLASQREGGPITLPAAGALLEDLARRANAYAWPGLTPFPGGGPNIDSGSGLTVSNKLSARDVVGLLSYAHGRADLFPAFLGTLPVPLHTPSRMLKGGSGDWLTRITAKTGSLSEPVTVLALAGYWRMRDGGWGAFAVIINGSRQRSYIPFAETMGAIRSDMERVLARY